MIPVLSLAAVVVLLCECHKARRREQRWRGEARLTRLELAAVEEREAQWEAFEVGLLADSFMELGQLHLYEASDWDHR